MSWDLASQIATSLGALLAAASLAAGFILYRLNQRDALAAQFWQMIAVTRPNIDQLKQMVSYELASDLASTAIHSRDLALPLEDFYKYCRPESASRPDREAVVAYLDKYFPVITVPLPTPLVHQYETQTIAVASDVALYQASFPGVYRVVNSTALLFRNVLGNSKEIVRDERLWKRFLPQLVDDDDRVSSLPHMKWMTGELLTDLAMRHMKGSREQIALVIQMLDITFETYLKMSASELMQVSRAERGEKVQPTSFTQTITEDLREAGTCLRHAFTAEQMQRYEELLGEFEKTGESGGQEPEEETPRPAEEAPKAVDGLH
jgi:hypothetical protein